MDDLAKFIPRQRAGRQTLSGKWITLETIDWDKHGAGLASVVIGPGNADLWAFIPLGPFDDQATFQSVMSYVAQQREWATMVIVSKIDGCVLGMASYMRNRPEHGSTEVGCVVFSKALQKTRAATEAMYLMAKHVFEDLNYRRYEWKCHNDNGASKRAAERFGFVFEGVFRQDMVMKGKNRDTAWFSMIDSDWPRVRAGYEAWLSNDNFDGKGRQIRSLRDCYPT